MTPDELSTALHTALSDAVSAGAITLASSDVPDMIHVERPRQRDHGDWATNVALQLAKKAGQPPRVLADALAARLQEQAGIARVDVAGPGFLNITLDTAAAGELARTIVEAGGEYGRSAVRAGRTINLEFVSANPTGPIHIGGTRWAAVGDSLARILQATGAHVVKEYYFNDHGAQIDRFARSLVASAQGLPVPEDGYGGQYIHDIAQQVLALAAAEGIDVLGLDPADTQEFFRARGVELMFGQIKQSLHDFGVDFDVYFHENHLYESGEVDKAIAKLRDNGHIFEQDGATWLRTTTFGDDKDRVVIKSDGDAAYIAGDIAYYLNKRERGSDEVVIMLGADHHGYIGRLMAVCAAFGDTPHTNLEVLIGQMVNLVKDGEPLRMSKRAGTVVTLEDLVDIVGVDAARYALARSSVDQSIDIDLDVLAKASNDNPVFYVQYAHARTANVARNAAAAGVHRDDAFDPATLSHPTETELIGRLTEYPRIVEQAAQLREQHRVARYAEALAGAYHKWYSECRVTPLSGAEVTDTHRTRLWLNDATGQVLRNALSLLGVSAPERM
ncbi:arginine--tRNA ligase [Jonesia denitrificans]|uniref:Arginine--tRNA ligase n=1 Tax=Jonesia denitrificans (strain ATCC 14870 / DSM 20603 / BCRC 15368 / CIP 55.134 / JCM 11481 / NBRC 15587 / NCTC 10816 / Prevot 55134) TaxID=471856 RepID=C7QZD8_JONDD|nr:arginine--tRNA ligase [Jonesia denitrificans]ACV09436.1 arginyl-tRNA synthetase [Jonesia denitrificans DSM 20603]ASE09321.1 arginine--tRNA ligase [Jonesia denitrificans]QXB43865.1 arginine--tRNA ligase [Jonesia denitrificans]SQH21777.1 Arginine--tRNA ligase [Jonesia denitrificans]